VVKLAGLKAGPARAETLTEEQRQEFTKKAANGAGNAAWIAEDSAGYLGMGWLAAPSRGPVRRSQWGGLTAKATIQPPIAMHTGKIT